MPGFQDLYDNPTGIGKQYAVVVTGTGAQSRKKDAQGATLELMQVKSSVPVYASLAASADHLRIEASGSAGTSTPQVYFLPWAKKNIYRIRPKISGTTGLDGNLFFTPNLDGCMVSVEGTAEAPTIYHSNSSGVVYSTLEEEQMTKIADEGMRNETEAMFKIRRMVDGVDVFSTIPRKKPIDTSGFTEHKKADFDFLEYDTGSKQVITPNKFDGMDMDQVAAYGAVFGVRKKGQWTFYKQRFRVKQRAWDELQSHWFSKPTVARTQIRQYVVVSCDQFWPR